jgi:HAMP domain-containing protein
MLMVDLSLAEVDQLAAAVLGQQILQSLMTVIIVIAALISFMYLIVTRPLAYFLRITRAIADGDLSRRVNITAKDEIGELGASFNSMTQNILARTQELERLNKIAATELTERKRAEELLEEERRRLQQALDEVRTLRGIVPICSYCKKIRDDEGYWKQVEQYVSEHTEAKFSHGICPACFEKEMNELKS